MTHGVEPLPSRYPALADGTLVEANSAAMHFPVVAGLPQPGGVANPLLVCDFGSTFNPDDLSGAMAFEPPSITNGNSPLARRVDADRIVARGRMSGALTAQDKPTDQDLAIAKLHRPGRP
jgi:hypothetical protein